MAKNLLFKHKKLQTTIRRGTLTKITNVSNILKQSTDLAREITNIHRIEAE
jgi:hypothetical protein